MNFQASIVARLQLRVPDVEIEIAGHEQVQVAIQIVVAESRASVPDLAAAHAGFYRHIFKRAVAAVAIKDVETEICDE